MYKVQMKQNTCTLILITLSLPLPLQNNVEIIIVFISSCGGGHSQFVSYPSNHLFLGTVQEACTN